MKKVSIITICKNDEVGLERTIESVLIQKYSNIEYIVIDGGSTSDTISVIQKYSEYIDNWISEPDNGIYDAMNKGVRLSTGDFVLFLNAGDILFKSDTIVEVMSMCNDKLAFIYGDAIIQNKYGKRIWRAGNLDKLWKGMQFSHQSLLVNKEIFKELMFDLDYKISGDFKFIYSMYRRGGGYIYYPAVVSIIVGGGVSDNKRILSIKERYRFVNSQLKSTKVKIYYFIMIIKEIITKIAKFVVPKGLIDKIYRSKYISM